MGYLWTAECVGAGHSDKLADQFADIVLDHCLDTDPDSRVACEILLKDSKVVVAGEITTKASIDDAVLATKFTNHLKSIGYDYVPQIINLLSQQSPEISGAIGNKNIGASDQGWMNGYATDETDNFMPLTPSVARYLVDLHSKFRSLKTWEKIVFSDCKSQATLEMNGASKAIAIEHLVLSTHHSQDIEIEDLRNLLLSFKEKTETEFKLKIKKFSINPAGSWTFGGPWADCGLTGRKLAIDGYGSDCPWGGGNLSGKSPNMADRNGPYMARYIAKNLVANDAAKKAQVQLSYVIGEKDPSSFTVFLDEKPISKSFLNDIRKNIDLSPLGIVEKFDLKNLRYTHTSQFGHFGIKMYPWEQIEKWTF